MEKINNIKEFAKASYETFVRVSVTDPKHCKAVKVNGKQPFTNIDTYFLIQEATKEFGFYGAGFGLKDIKYDYIDFDTTKLCVINATFFFPYGEFPITNSLKMAYMTQKGYLTIDEDVYKKLETNTLAKALSKIGFGADVYMGKFEDASYIDEALNATALCTPQQQQELRKMLGYYSLDAILVNKQFHVSVLSELPQKDYNEAVAFINMIGQQNKK